VDEDNNVNIKNDIIVRMGKKTALYDDFDEFYNKRK
jgi:hypothetical protein